MNEFEDGNEPLQSVEHENERVLKVQGMFNNYFLDYASYVILERAVPHLNDGLKPVQRRILHSLEELHDGRFHKVANVIGNTMKYHPHGDASIGDAMVQIGQKEMLLDCQGNWGNTATGDRAAAPRYIEVRLSKLGKEILFNAKTTKWLASYDGRNKEPDTLPVKFPLLLAQGVEGIAVGMACRTLPHNFVEILDASISVLQGKSFQLYPDFLAGGMADVENYNDGLRGGRVRVRAKLEKLEAKVLAVRELPFGVTTTTLIDSILKANDKGKIKIKRVEDNTAAHVEVLIYLATGVSPDKTMDALYAFTDCEVSLAPNSAVILDDKPHFKGVKELLQISTDRTRNLLGLELEIELGELEEQWHFASLEKIFIEKRVYRDIEECESWKAILEAIHQGLKPFISHLLRTVTDEDVTRLTEIRIKRISKFDSIKADDKIAGLEGDIAQVKNDLNHLTDYAIEWFRQLKIKHGKGRERKTELRSFDSINRADVAVVNAKLHANFEEGFVGMGLKRGDGEYVCDCNDLDDVIVIRKDGVMLVSKVSHKAFFGKDILHVGIWKRGDERTVYNCIYHDGATQRSFMKRFSVTSITRDREYHISKGTPKSRILYFTTNPNGEAESVTVFLRANPRLKKLKLDIDFCDLAIKGRGAAGNLVSKFAVRKIEMTGEGVSTLGARKVWYDETVRRLNVDGRGRFLGEFKAEDRLIVFLSSGYLQFTGFDLSMHFDEKMIHLEKWRPKAPVSVVYFEGEKEDWYVKRFLPEYVQKPFKFIGENDGSRIGALSTLHFPVARIRYNKRFKETRDLPDDLIALDKFIAIKGIRALGNKLSALPVTEISIEPANEERERKADPATLSPASSPSEISPELTSESAVAPAPATLAVGTPNGLLRSTPADADSAPLTDDEEGQARLF